MEQDINYIYILDYSDATICEIDLANVEEDKKDDIEYLLELYGCNINTCSWMTTKDRINDIIKLNQ